MEQQTDEQLVANYLKGEEMALDLLVQKYLSGIYNFAFKYVHTTSEAEDVAQETFVKAWQKLDTFNPKFKFKTWLFTIAKNTALDHLKKRGLVPFSEIEDTQMFAKLTSTDPLPEEILNKLGDIQMIGHAVNKLPLKYREVIRLYYTEELNFREIAELLKESINTIKTRHRRAVARLRNLLKIG